MTSLATAQRQALSDLFDRVGPDAPTLNEGWTTRDLAAHLATRDRRPDAAAGIMVPALAGYTADAAQNVGHVGHIGCHERLVHPAPGPSWSTSCASAPRPTLPHGSPPSTSG